MKADLLRNPSFDTKSGPVLLELGVDSKVDCGEWCSFTSKVVLDQGGVEVDVGMRCVPIYMSFSSYAEETSAHHPTICSLVPFLLNKSIMPCWKGMSTAI